MISMTKRKSASIGLRIQKPHTTGNFDPSIRLQSSWGN
jgi:hypothetical protein